MDDPLSDVKAITQVVGYLMLENGVFLFGLTLARAVVARLATLPSRISAGRRSA